MKFLFPFARCPKSGRITGLRSDLRSARVWWPVFAVLAIGWFLLRVIPKPSRAAYPCQRVAAGIGAGFLSQMATVLLALAGFRLLRGSAAKGVAVSFATFLGIVVYVGSGIGTQAPDAPVPQVLTPSEGPNSPMGTPKGANPGRVVWAQDFTSTSWDGNAGHWWEDKNVDQGAVDRMFSKTLQSLSGKKSDKQAWEALFRNHNKVAGRGERGYQAGEKIVVKLNCNADTGKPWGNRGYPTPHAVSTLVRQLVENAGVPGEAIVLTDPSRVVGDTIYQRVRSLPGDTYRQVTFEGQEGPVGPQRVKPAPDMNNAIHFKMADGKPSVLYLPKSYTDAAYLIDFALMRPHRVFGITGAGKNHFGSVYDPELKIFKPSMLHAFALWGYPTPNKSGESHSHVELLGHKSTGGKTLLYFLDALYTSYNQGADVVRWSTLDGRWFSSILMSQDPVAMDSVAYDLIVSEPNLTKANPSFNGHADSYLHEAALADRPPSKVKYDPENDGSVLPSLGVHEHWNNAAEKKYSRNLGRKQGIELVALK